MKLLFLSALLLMLFCYHINAEDMIPQIQLPDLEMMLPPVRPSRMQNENEALPLVEENQTIMEYFEYINRGEYEEALKYIRKSNGFMLELIEKGDPEGELKKHVVKGGFIQMDVTGTQFKPGAIFNHISAYLLYIIGYNYFSLEKYEEAEIAFLASLTPLPDFLSAHISLGQVYMLMDRYEDARKHLVHAAGLGMNTAGLYATLGYINYKTDNIAGAEKAYQKAVLFNPDFKRPKQYELGLLYSLFGTYQYRSALTLVEYLLKNYPDDAYLWLFRASAASNSGEREVALSSLETAIRLGDLRVSNLQVCAALHMELGSIERAVELLKLGLAKGMDFVYIDQGMSWLEQAEEWELLEQMINEIHTKWDSLKKPQQSRVLIREAGINTHKGDMSTASVKLGMAIELDPSNANAMMSLANIYREKGNYNSAELLYQKASIDALYRENALISLAQLALDQEDITKALKILRDMLKEFPGRADLNKNIESLEKIVVQQKDN